MFRAFVPEKVVMRGLWYVTAGGGGAAGLTTARPWEGQWGCARPSEEREDAPAARKLAVGNREGLSERPDAARTGQQVRARISLLVYEGMSLMTSPAANQSRLIARY